MRRHIIINITNPHPQTYVYIHNEFDNISLHKILKNTSFPDYIDIKYKIFGSLVSISY